MERNTNFLDNPISITFSQVSVPSEGMIFTGQLVKNYKRPYQPRIFTSKQHFSGYRGFLDVYSKIRGEPPFSLNRFYRFLIQDCIYEGSSSSNGPTAGFFFARPLRELFPNEPNGPNVISPTDALTMRSSAQNGCPNLIILNETILKDFEHMKEVYG